MATHESEMKKIETSRTLLTYGMLGVLGVMLIVVIVLMVKLASRPAVPESQLTPITDLVTKTEEPSAAPTVTAVATTEPVVIASVEPSTEPVTLSKYVVTNKRVNIRSQADSSSEKVDTVDAGTILPLVGYEDDWAIVDYNGQKAYVYGIYVDETDSNP